MRINKLGRVVGAGQRHSERVKVGAFKHRVNPGPVQSSRVELTSGAEAPRKESDRWRGTDTWSPVRQVIRSKDGPPLIS